MLLAASPEYKPLPANKLLAARLPLSDAISANAPNSSLAG